MRSRISASVWAAVPLVLLLGCSDGGPTAPHAAVESVPLQLSANLSGTPIATLVVEVTAPDITTPLAYNLHANNGQASGSIQIPPGNARTITVRAFDTDGTVTHEGSATVNVSRGNNPPVQIPMIPRSGHQPIDLTLAEVSITVSPGVLAIGTGEAAPLSATVMAAGGPVSAVVGWATLNPAVATVNGDGLVTGVSGGNTVIVATYAGVGAAINVQVLTGQETDWYADADGDGYGDPLNSIVITVPPAGYVSNPDDCDDTDAATNPSAPEIFDGNDNDCDGTVDEGFVPTPWYADADGDTYGDPTVSLLAVDAPPGFVGNAGDCNDADGTVNPSAPETDGDGIDNDCDGTVDSGFGSAWYADADGDGFGDPATRIFDFAAPPGFVADNTDCDDADHTVNPAAPELLDGRDNDCNGVADDGIGGVAQWYQDADADGFGSAATWVIQPAPPPGFTNNPSDCNDFNPMVNPSRPDFADGIDNNCNSLFDEPASAWYRDRDADHWGDASMAPLVGPFPGPGFLTIPGDCDDIDPSRYTGALELLNGLDDNCNGIVDDL